MAEKLAVATSSSQMKKSHLVVDIDWAGCGPVNRKKRFMTMLISLASVLFLMAVHIGVSRMHFLERESWRSAGAGIALSYVFLDILPHLATSQQSIQTVVNQGFVGFLAHHAYLLALSAFILYLGLARLAVLSTNQANGLTAEARAHWAVFPVILGLAAYCALIGFLIGEQPDHRYEPVIVFALAMTIHIAGVDHVVRGHDPSLYDRAVRYLFVASTFAGWLLGAVVFVPDAIFGMIFCFVVGAILVVAFVFELPTLMSGGNYWQFLLGLGLFAALLLAYEASSKLSLES